MLMTKRKDPRLLKSHGIMRQHHYGGFILHEGPCHQLTVTPGLDNQSKNIWIIKLWSRPDNDKPLLSQQFTRAGDMATCLMDLMKRFEVRA